MIINLPVHLVSSHPKSGVLRNLEPLEPPTLVPTRPCVSNINLSWDSLGYLSTPVITGAEEGMIRAAGDSVTSSRRHRYHQFCEPIDRQRAFSLIFRGHNPPRASRDAFVAAASGAQQYLALYFFPPPLPSSWNPVSESRARFLFFSFFFFFLRTTSFLVSIPRLAHRTLAVQFARYA